MRDYQKEFVEKATNIHHGFYSYSKVPSSWKDFQPKKPIIICPKHGEFRQRASVHANGAGCPECAKGKRKFSYSDAINKAMSTHGNKYNYSEVQVNWCGFNKKYDIICPTHGVFNQLFRAHANGQGCPKCCLEKSSEQKIHSIEYVQSKLKELFPDIEFPYLGTEYTTSKSKITGVCKEHGEFRKTFNMLYRGRVHGCPTCSAIARGIASRLSIEDVLEKCVEIHGDFYTYPNMEVEYKTCDSQLTIVCPKHGGFKQKMGNHVYCGQGCPKCSAGVQKSKGEIQLCEWLEDYAEVEDSRRDLLTGKHGKEIDVYLPEHKLGIEFNGLYWHSEGTGTPNNSHLDKLELAESKGIRLLQFWDFEWTHKQPIVKSIIMGAMGAFQHKIGARKLKVHDATSKQARLFCDTNHIQGFRAGKIYVGLWDSEELISLLIISSAGEIIRFVNKLNYSVPGAFSRLLSKVPKPLFSFVDKRLFNGHSYKACGFEYLYSTKPNYRYTKTGKTFESRLKYQKHKLKGILENFDETKTEVQNMRANGYYRVFDCGNMKYILK